TVSAPTIATRNVLIPQKAGGGPRPPPPNHQSPITNSRPREHQMAAFGVDPDGVAAGELAGLDLLRQRVLDLGLDRALERTRAVHRVETDVAQQLQRRVRQLQLQAALVQALLQAVQ